jgi:TP901 family phage tail tape measure protein
VGAFVVATKSAGEFGDSFNEILTLIDGTSEEIDRFRQDILDYARDSGKSLSDITASLYNVISAGEDYKTSLDFLQAAEQLAIGTKSDLNTAIEILRPTLTAFGKGTEEAGNFANILFLAVKNGKLTLSELEPVLSNVTGIATASGVSFDQVAAALAALTAAGAPVNLAVTQLKGALTGIFAPAEGAAEAAKNLEIEFGKNALTGKTLNEVFALMVEKTGGTLEGMKALIPRVEGASAALVLGGAAAKTYGDTLDQMKNNTEAATEAYKKMAENFNLANQNIINNLKVTLIEVGLPLLDEWGEFAESLAVIFGKAAEDGGP